MRDRQNRMVWWKRLAQLIGFSLLHLWAVVYCLAKVDDHYLDLGEHRFWEMLFEALGFPLLYLVTIFGASNAAPYLLVPNSLVWAVALTATLAVWRERQSGSGRSP